MGCFMSLRNYVIRRILFSIPMFLGISIVLFGLIMLAPLDYVDVLKQNDPTMTEVEMENRRNELGLNRPPYEQYFYWLLGISDDHQMEIDDILPFNLQLFEETGSGNETSQRFAPSIEGKDIEASQFLGYMDDFLDFVLIGPARIVQDITGINLNAPPPRFAGGFIFGNMGNSFAGSKINDMIGDLAWQTIKLQLASLLMSLLIGIPLGIYSARHPYSKSDTAGTLLALFGVSMPVFWTGIMFILLFSDMKIFFGIKIPSIGSKSYKLTGSEGPIGLLIDEIAHMILPTIVLGLAGTALVLRLTRSSMLEVLRQDYILTARSKGLPERLVIYKHALRNALLPVVTIVGLSIGFLLSGAALTETVFRWPGLGREAVARIELRDYNFMMGINMLVAIMVILANLVTDITYAFLDPRIRY
jgi:peptide/nickel transport system permease protein